MDTTDKSLVKKGLIALAAVAIIGASSSVYAAVNDSTNATSGYGTGSETALAAIDKLNQDFDAESNDFQADVNALIGTARTDLQAAGGADDVDDFANKFGSASSTYDNRVNAAADEFRTKIQSAASTAESKDQFIDAYNRAKADYFNSVEQAKNDFAAVVSNLGDNANQAKDRFIGGYNSAKGDYGNQLEVIKNDFAATLG